MSAVVTLASQPGTGKATLGNKIYPYLLRKLPIVRANQVWALDTTFTASDFTDAVLNKGCKLSMDGRGAWRDNIFVERVWRSAKYERIYLKAYDGVAAARADIADYFNWYNTERPHSSLERVTPEQTYLNSLPKLAEAA